MALFSERYGYTKPSDVIIREQIPEAIQNAICSCYDDLQNSSILRTCISSYCKFYYQDMEMYLWTHFLNERKSEFRYDRSVATFFIEDSEKTWYEKLDILEFSIKYLYSLLLGDPRVRPVVENFVQQLNSEFERLHFAYRVVNNEIAEITSKAEISAIEEAMDGPENIKKHLDKALRLYAQRPTPDPCNSIKESISAVEAFCREKTNEDTLGKALNKLELNGIVFPKLLKTAWDKLYAYTNQKDTGIRHALMDADSTYTPSVDEALYMLISCSAFINYLRKKI